MAETQFGDPKARADRLWRMSAATKLDAENRALAAALEEKIVADPEQAAFLIAALVQLSNQE